MDSARALGLALLVHGIVIALLAIHLSGSEAMAPPAPVIQAKVVQEISRAPAPTREQRHRAQEEQARRRAQEQRQRALALQRAAAEKAKKLAARRKAEAAAKKKAAAERRKRQQELQQRQARKQLQQQLAAEEAQRESDAERVRAAREADAFKSKIFARVSRNWIVPPDVDRKLQCTVQVRLVPGGDVISVTVVSSSGNANFDRSVENAVYKSSPLPVPTDTAAFEQLRELVLKFSPKDIQR
jgi:colicin import membrane protein